MIVLCFWNSIYLGVEMRVVEWVVDDIGLPLVGPICTLANTLIKILSLDGDSRIGEVSSWKSLANFWYSTHNVNILIPHIWYQNIQLYYLTCEPIQNQSLLNLANGIIFRNLKVCFIVLCMCWMKQCIRSTWQDVFSTLSNKWLISRHRILGKNSMEVAYIWYIVQDSTGALAWSTSTGDDRPASNPACEETRPQDWNSRTLKICFKSWGLLMEPTGIAVAVTHDPCCMWGKRGETQVRQL